MISKKILKRENIKTVLIAMLCLFVSFTMTGCAGSGDVSVEETSMADSLETADLQPQGEVNVPGENSIDVPGAVGNVVGEDDGKNTDKMVSLTLENMGRVNPFVPANDLVLLKTTSSEKAVSLPKLDLVDPPFGTDTDSDAAKVATTKISGIMFDKYNPSAIINIESTDYLVRSGDVINGYKILAISPQTVTVQRGSNVYKAGVGEAVSKTDGINYNQVPNLSQKFGGSK